MQLMSANCLINKHNFTNRDDRSEYHLEVESDLESMTMIDGVGVTAIHDNSLVTIRIYWALLMMTLSLNLIKKLRKSCLETFHRPKALRQCKRF